jgi:hypothetical protein
VRDSTVEHNQAQGGAGDVAGGPGLGGGLFVNVTAGLDLRGATVTANHADGGPGDGGGVYLAFGVFARKDSSTAITANRASTAGDDVRGRLRRSRLLGMLGL